MRESFIKKIVKNKYFPFITMFIILLVCHLTFKLNFGDDVFFRNVNYREIFSWLSSRYNNWSSRIFIEFTLVSMLKLPSFVWCILNSLIIVLIVYSISRIFSIKNKWIIILSVMVYPLYEMKSAGWYATTINYIWPLSFGLFSLIPIKNIFENKKEKWYMYILYTISLIFACNHEQMCAIVFAFYLIFSIYYFIKNNKKASPYLVIQLLFALISLIFIFTCPGNAARKVSETNNWYPAFESFGMLGKTYLGFVSTFVKSVYSVNLPLLVLSILIPIFTFKKTKKEFIRLISLVPILIFLLISIFPTILNSIFPHISSFVQNSRVYGDSPNSVSIGLQSLSALGICVIFYISILFSIFKLFDGKEKWLYCLIVLAGLSSRIIMGFSPTLYASDMRTFIFYDFSIIIVIIAILEKYFRNINKKYFYTILTCLSIIQLLQTIACSYV